MEKKSLVIIAIIIIVLILAVLTTVITLNIFQKINQGKQKGEKGSYNVGIVEAKKTLIKEMLSAQSIVQGNPQVKVYPNNINGIFIRNSVKEGDFVSKDFEIAYIDRNMPGSDFMPAPVKSPIEGIVTKLYYLDKGANVVSTLPIAEIANVSSLKVVLTLGENELLKIKKGQPVKITSEHNDAININAFVDSVTPFIDNDTFSGSITAVIDNQKRLLTIGMTVNVKIEISQRQGYMVPESAVLMGQDKTYIFISNDGKAKMINVKTGYSSDGLIEVIGKIQEKDHIVVEGNFKLFEGAPIKISTIDENEKKNEPKKENKDKKKKK